MTYYVDQVGDEETVCLVTIYDKSEEATITKADLRVIVQEALTEETDETEE